MLFLINVVIAVATFWNAAEDHSKAYADFRETLGSAKAKALRKFILLWIVPLLSIATIPLTWSEQTESERKISDLKKQTAEATERTALIESTNLLLKSNVFALERQLLLVSNAVAIVSPSNAPITSAKGSGYILIQGNDTNLFTSIKNKRVVLELNGATPTHGAVVSGIILDSRSTSQSDLNLSLWFDDSNVRGNATWSGVLSFNSLKNARLNLFPESRSPRPSFEIKQGVVNLELNPQYGLWATFGFPPQTNQLGGVIGIRDWPFAPPEKDRLQPPNN